MSSIEDLSAYAVKVVAIKNAINENIKYGKKSGLRERYIFMYTFSFLRSIFYRLINNLLQKGRENILRFITHCNIINYRTRYENVEENKSGL